MKRSLLPLLVLLATLTACAEDDPTGLSGEPTDVLRAARKPAPPPGPPPGSPPGKPVPELAIVKTANPAGPIPVGEPVGYDIVVSNNGSGTAANVIVTDFLDQNRLTWSLATGAPTHCSVFIDNLGLPILECGPVDLAPDESFAVHVTSSPTDPGHCPGESNVATAEADNHDPVFALATVEVGCPDIAVVKTAHPADVSIAAGDPFGFDITVTNDGLGTGVNVILNDILPLGPTWSLAAGAPDHCSIMSGKVIGGNELLQCGPVDLVGGESYSVRVTAPNGVANCGTVSNDANAAGDNFAPASSEEASVVIVCPPIEVPDIAISKFAKAETVSAGEDIGFELAVVNNGPETAVNVTLTDNLPDTGHSWTIVDDPFGDPSEDNFCSIGVGGLGEQILECDPGALVAGAGFGVSVTSPTDADDCGTVLNSATADADNDDPVSASASVTVECPDIAILKTAFPTDHVPGLGDLIGFDIRVSNNGPGMAFDVTLTDALPEGGFNWTLAAGAPLHCVILGSVGGQGLECGPVDLAAGGFFSVRVTSDAAECGTVTNSATAQAANDDPVSDSDSVGVVCPPQ